MYYLHLSWILWSRNSQKWCGWFWLRVYQIVVYVSGAAVT